MIDISFRVDGKAVPQPRPKAFVTKMGARMYEAPSGHEIFAYKEHVQFAAGMAFHATPPLDVPVAVYITFVTKRVKPLRKTKPNPRVWNSTKIPGDIDNLAKAVLDAMSGVCFTDDGRVSKLVAQKIQAAEGEEPHVAVRVQQLA